MKKANMIINIDGTRIVQIKDVMYKGKREEWTQIEKYLKKYVGECYEIEQNCEKIFISTDFPDEFANSESRIALKGAVAKAKPVLFTE